MLRERVRSDLIGLEWVQVQAQTRWLDTDEIIVISIGAVNSRWLHRMAALRIRRLLVLERY